MQGLILALLTLAPPAAAPTAAGLSFASLARQADEARDANRLDQALSLYRQAVKTKPDWDEGWWAIGTIAYDQDKYAECALAFRRFTALKPDFAPAWIMSGLCEYRLHHFASAYQSLLRADALGFQATPDLARAGRLHLVFLLTKNGNFERAIVLCTRLYRNTSITPEIAAAAGIAGLRRTWLPEEVPPADRPLVMAFGEALAATSVQKFEDAVARYEAALKAFPDNAEIHYRFGTYLLRDPLNNAADRGLDEIKTALKLDPTHVPALVGLTVEYLTHGDYGTACQYGERAVKIAPDDFAAHLMYGRALLEDRKLQDAILEIELAVKFAPDSPDAHFSLASAYARAGRKEDAARETTEFQRLKKLLNSRVGSQ
ncbi:MAG: tetratricopeptide repeat protein [Bryobacteraceae bacterium]|jgi:tetratricopeptide (TPR) repeat protein